MPYFITFYFLFYRLHNFGNTAFLMQYCRLCFHALTLLTILPRLATIYRTPGCLTASSGSIEWLTSVLKNFNPCSTLRSSISFNSYFFINTLITTLFAVFMYTNSSSWAHGMLLKTKHVKITQGWRNNMMREIFLSVYSKAWMTPSDLFFPTARIPFSQTSCPNSSQ